MTLEQQVLVGILVANYLLVSFATSLAAWLYYDNNRRRGSYKVPDPFIAWAAWVIAPIAFIHAAVNALLLVYLGIRAVMGLFGV